MKALLASLLRWSRVVFTPLSLLLIVWLIWQSRASLGAMADESNWSMLLVVVLLWVLGNALVPAVSVQVFRSCGVRLTYPSAFHIHCNRLPAKYLPGGIWHSVGRAHDYHLLGIGGSQLAVYFIVENFLLVAVTLTLSAGIVAPLVALPIVSLFLTWLPVLLGLALLLFPLVARPLTRGKVSPTAGAYAAGALLQVVYWCLLGLAFTVYISAFEGLGLDVSKLETAAIYIFSWCLGYLALFAPQGIGVAEFISGNLLRAGGAAELLAFLVGFRLVVLVADLLSWALAAVLRAASSKAGSEVEAGR
jgi:hypothetical protein